MKPNSFASVWVRALCAIGMISILSGCASLQTDTTTVTGSVTYRERIALSPDSTFLVVRLLDVSKADAPSIEIASLRQPVGNPPMVFILPYDASKINPKLTYGLEAKIVTSDGDVLFRNDQTYRVLTRDAPNDVDILVRPITHAQSDGARKTDGGDVSRDVAAIDARLEDMRVIPGQYVASDHTVTYKAYVSPDGEPLLVDEHRDLGKFGTSDVKLYYRNSQLLQFSERATRVNYGGANDDKPLEYNLKLDFAQGRFSSGSKSVNGVASSPDEHEISGALSQSKVALSRIDAMLAQLNTKPTVLAGSKSFVCDDNSRFSVSFENDGDRAIVEFLGREPIALSRMPTGSGYGYRNDMYELRGKGEDAIWRTSMGNAHCAVSVSPDSQSISVAHTAAPGDFPVVTIRELTATQSGIWTEYFDEMLPAITACLTKNSGDLVSVLKAWPMNHGMVGVRTVNGNGGRHDCLVPADGMGTIHTELVEATTNILPGEDDVRFTPANGAYPTGKCFGHERIVKDGVFIGWLSKNSCP
ncbi:MAG: YbaY family lipoprotein [Rhodospirillales bacterium]|nr:YbaY family lipoprotein [Rhodospirillales bacterium]